ncbi:S-acyl fatty acid synthase thioesterase, medium chain [Erwinia amylovora]|nr:S-acyl fatty acid synthase thioesterase, medium chain [Erwinia amylovora]CBJ47656.1 putative thioesterase [Erwinia amylovora ATCC 49946]QJQ59536.1 S-acyl fatty acid synthase thioesterase, medium chain [Erwinia amylovora]QJQ63235.1 S-acyl fatty acid synthase thioesterase, medium chain [Erwinia amylovora]QJQ67037.1 S-acyl fatty acid synthase thioesterase, medium chain [Erwinia amylovora]
MPKMLLTTQPSPDKYNLICFPYAGGNSHFYLRWRQLLGHDIAIHPVHLPGRGNYIKTPSLNDMDSLVNIMARELTLFRGMRFAFVGTSMGGWIACHLTQKLLRLNVNLLPECLVLCSTASPEHRFLLPDLDGVDMRTALARIRDFNPACMRTLRHPELASLFLPVLQADFKLCREWRFANTPRLNCPVLAFHGEQDSLVSEEMMYHWQTLTDRSFELMQVRGDHFFSETPSEEFCGILKDKLNKLSDLRRPVVR